MNKEGEINNFIVPSLNHNTLGRKGGLFGAGDRINYGQEIFLGALLEEFEYISHHVNAELGSRIKKREDELVYLKQKVREYEEKLNGRIFSRLLEKAIQTIRSHKKSFL